MSNLLNVNRVAFTIGSTEIYWYGVIICAAILVAILVATIYSKKKGYETDLPINIAIVILPAGILCARLFAVLFDSSLSLSDYFNFRTGGMSIIGAVIGGGLALLIYCLIKKEKEPFKFFDTLAVVLILAQAIGRWGNYFNEEVYGQVVEAGSFFAKFPFAVLIDGTYYQALFFYEFCANIVIFVLLSYVHLNVKNTGYVTSLYLILYGMVRTVLEPLRQAEYILKFQGLPISQLLSATMIAFGVLLFVIRFVVNNKKKVNKNEQES